MLHVTLNTGHIARLPADLVLAETRLLLSPLLLAGGGPFPGGGSAYRVQILNQPMSAIFTIFRGRDPLSVNALARTPAGAAEIWPLIERTYLNLGDQAPNFVDLQNYTPTKPTEHPWLATLILPALLVGTARGDVGFIGHMASCLGLMLNEDGQPPAGS